MKRAALACAILITIWTLSYFSIKRIGSDFENATKFLVSGEALVKINDFQNAAREFDQAVEIWNADDFILSVLIRHNEYAEISMGLARIREYAKEESKKDVMAEVSAMKILLEDVFQNQLISLKSIL